MKLSREYILGVGSGLIISALLSLFLPAGTAFLPRSVPVANPAKPGMEPGREGAPADAGSAKQASDAQPASQPAGQAAGAGGTANSSASTNQGSTSNKNNTKNISTNASTSTNVSTNVSTNIAGNPQQQGIQNGQAPERQFIIPSGATADKIADLLVKQGYISDKEQFLALVKQQGAESRFRAGTYNLPEKSTPEEMITRLLNPPG